MKLRVYMNNWPINMGIIGFLNILKDTECVEEIKKSRNYKKENYIEFDSSILENFHEYYFKYFMNEYDLSKRIENSINYNLSYLKKNEDKIKDITKKIKENIKYQADKVKKFDSDNFNELKIRFDEIGKIKSFDNIEELEKLCQECVDIFRIKHINEKLTLNLYKYIVGDNFFGQVSFFNVAKSSLDENGLKKVMYNDYLLPIIYNSKLNDILELNSMDMLSKFILESLAYIDNEVKSKRISKSSIKTIEKIFKDINSQFIKKNKGIEDVKFYLDNLKSCEMCGSMKGLVSNYTESNFVPLAVSADNAMNMYWNMNLDFSICDICKLILFCTPAGATLVRKNYIQNGDNEFYSFVNMDTSVKELFDINNNFRNRRDKEISYEGLIIDIVGENKKKSEWQLKNILFVEFKASVDAKKCIMNYFNMPTYLAKFFSSESQLLDSVKDKNLKASLIDIILKEKDLKFLIQDKLRIKMSQVIESNKGFTTLSSDIYKLIKIRYVLNCYKKGGTEKVDDKKLKSIRYAGREIRDYYESINSKNKINGIAYKLLNTAKVRNKKDFMDTILRLFMSCEKSVPTAFLNVMSESELDFESIAYSFISGLISEKYEPNTEEVK